MAHVAVFVFVTVCPFVDVVKGEEQFLLACLRVNEVTLFHVGLHQLITPPREPHVFWLHGVVVFATEV